MKNPGTSIPSDTTYVVISFSLTHKGNFSIVSPRKKQALNNDYQQIPAVNNSIIIVCVLKRESNFRILL